MDLRTYDLAKFELAEILRTLSGVAKDQPHEYQDQLRELFARLAEDRFNLVVVGRYSRGKTSLMNAILHSDKLPIGVVPLTSVITTVAYGSREQVIIHYEHERLPSEVPLRALSEYVTQRHNPGNARHVKTAEVRLPAEILRRGFHFIDTPGLGSAIPENAQTTAAFLPEADAFVLVTSFGSPLSAEELDLLRTASQSARRAFVVINKQDTVSTEERAEAMRFVQEQLCQAFGEAAPPVFSVSARDALAARLGADATRLAASGIQAFEAELTRFLLADKSGQFLLRLIDRITDALRALPAAGETQRLEKRLRRLSTRIGAGGPPVGVRSPAPAAAASAVERPCAICGHVLHASFEFLRRYQYDLSFRLQTQRSHARHGGFCASHAWRYAVIASPHGICTGYPPLLERVSRKLRDVASRPLTGAGSVPERLAALLATEATCPLCAICAQAEQDAVASIVEALVEPTTATAAIESGVCLQHLPLLCAAITEPDTVRAIVEHQALILERLAEDMRRYATKHDAIRRALASEEELTASNRGLRALAGLPNVNPIGQRKDRFTADAPPACIERLPHS